MKRACKVKEEKNIQEEMIDKVEEMVEDVQPIQEQPIEDVIEDVQDEDVIDENRADDPVQDEEEVVVDNVEEEQPIDNNVEEVEEERIIEGYAIVFNELSEDLGGFREMILPEAIDQELINNSDIYYLYNHNNDSTPLARSNHGQGSLELTIDSKGLKYRFNCINSEFYELVKRGDLDKSSFAFSLPKDGSGEIWEKSQEYNYIRKIVKIEQLFDCSAVLVPAYSQTELYARNLSKREIDPSYYEHYDNIINQLSK
jgi:HK97 family phage prohead protease